MEEKEIRDLIKSLEKKHEVFCVCNEKDEYKKAHNEFHRNIYEDLLKSGVKAVLRYDYSGYATVNIILPGKIHSIEATLTLTT